jgi:hypothetical protein
MGDFIHASEKQTLAQKIRQFLRDLFGSRLVSTLELRVLEVQQECERRVADKDRVIEMLQSDLATVRAKLEMLETVVIPVISPVGNLFKPKPDKQTFEAMTGPTPGSWAWVQAEWDRKQREEIEAESLKEQ